MLRLILRGASLVSYVLLEALFFWKKLDLKPSTFMYHTGSYGYSAVLYHMHISLAVFLAVAKCAFVTMLGGSAVTYCVYRIFILLKICTTVIRQAENYRAFLVLMSSFY